jgi:RsiW-degrading membrane proteinase PrsW (M82 family)
MTSNPSLVPISAERAQLLARIGVALAILGILLNLDFFFRPGTEEVLGGLAHHAFVLGLLLVLTASTRTVSLGTLGIFWLVGVWSVYAVAYVFESQLAIVLGVKADDEFATVWLAPTIEEIAKLLPVAAYVLMTARTGRRHAAISDGLLLGFMVGAGVSFQEDAHFGKILVSGDGWSAEPPWTSLLPVISPVGKYLALNHALWGALSGLSVAAAVMLRPWQWTWPVALIGPLLSFTNHLMVNHVSFSEFGTRALLNRGREVPWFYETIRSLTDGGRLPVILLMAAAIAVVIGDFALLRWAARRDRLFPPARSHGVAGVVNGLATWAGVRQMIATGRYLRLRRSIYYAAWKSRMAGRNPRLNAADKAELWAGANSLGMPLTPAIAPADVVPETV